MYKTIEKLFLVSRPVSWVNTAYPFAIGYLLSCGTVDLLFVIATLYFLIPYNLMMYGINDVFDYESDILNPRKGGIEGMREERIFHPTIVKAVLITNIPFIILLLVLGTWQSALMLLAVVFFVIAYSIAKLRFKEKPVLDSVTSSLHFVGPLLFALTLTHLTYEAAPYVIAFFLWGVASHAFGAVQDILPDRQGKLSSIATFFGAKATVRFATVLYAIAAILIIIQPFPISIIGISGLFYVVNSAPYWQLTDKESSRANKPWRRFIWLNLFVGFVVTMVIIYRSI